MSSPFGQTARTPCRSARPAAASTAAPPCRTGCPVAQILFWSDGTWALMNSDGTNAGVTDVRSPITFEPDAPVQGVVIRFLLTP